MMLHYSLNSRKRRRAGKGFTLIEAALVTCIIGVGVVAMLQLLATGTVTNNTGTELTTALNLARNVREMTMGMSFCDKDAPTHWGTETGESLNGASKYDDLDDLHNLSFSPPIDARRQFLSNMGGWEQRVFVQCVDEDLLTSPVPNGSSPSARVTVKVFRNGQEICDVQWYAFDTAN